MDNEIIASLRRTVLVGVDGSPQALRAARWGAREAHRRGGPLHLVAAAGPGALRPTGVGGTSSARARDAVAGAARETLAEAAEAALTVVPGLEVRQQVRPGSALPVLVAESEWAGVLVLGTRGRGPLRTALSDSVTTALAAAARCPLVAVRGDLVAAERAGAPVLLLVDDSPAGHAARRFAAAAASSRSSPLVTVHLGANPAASSVAPRGPGPRGSDQHSSGPHEAGPHDARQLPALSAGAALVVVGVRARGRRLDAPAGPLVRRLLRTSQCPVGVVRDVPF
ncbi:hypothetical protein GCM10009836_49100 [Pseudonocardia ailaonensis]|uniref:UspA domain-containing protein n=1 Tax=Pseudonocardia ailaonensis TaxID=367279 RepID=A0ABN2NFP3_9PSEU